MKKRDFFGFTLVLCLIVTLCGITNRASAQGVKVIVVDAGHGGKGIPGAVYNGVCEKDIVLPIALRVGELISTNLEGVKVVYTRKSDKALHAVRNTDLKMRTEIANEAMGDLFISIHANAASNRAAYGAETIIMGESTFEQTRNESTLYQTNREDLIDMSDEKTAAIVRAYIQNLQFTYGEYSEALAQLVQKGYKDHNRHLRKIRKQPLMVLYGVNMPAVLTEIGFMTNKNEFNYMTSKKGQEEIAQSIFQGIKEYVTMVNKTIKANQSAPVVNNTQIEESQLNEGFTIQILSSGKVLKDSDRQFKGYNSRQWMMSSATGSYRYKYCVGRYKTRAEAAKELTDIRKSFKDAFIVEYKNGKIK